MAGSSWKDHPCKQQTLPPEGHLGLAGMEGSSGLSGSTGLAGNTGLAASWVGTLGASSTSSPWHGEPTAQQAKGGRTGGTCRAAVSSKVGVGLRALGGAGTWPGSMTLQAL